MVHRRNHRPDHDHPTTKTTSSQTKQKSTTHPQSTTHKHTQGHGHIFVGEESAFLSGVQDLTDAPHWFVDPLDGTTNFVHGRYYDVTD